ncbi:MAG: hypothetical protein ACJ73E_17440 [Mycobacteriales bacterium]
MPVAKDVSSRREELARKRQSRRPSRLGTPAGAAAGPDRVLDRDAGFPGLLRRAWQQAAAAPGLAGAVDTLLTLGGHVPADVQLRALCTAEEVALEILAGVSWRDGRTRAQEPPAGQLTGQRPAFVGEIGLTTSGRIAVRVPSQGPLAATETLVGGVLRVPWSPAALAAYRSTVDDAATRAARAAADCRDWLAAAPDREGMLELLKDAARRTAPFVLYQERRRYTNFRDRNTLTGKTLWPGHPDCALSSLSGVPLELWSDSDAVLVTCLTLLVRSAGYARIEEANGTQLTVDHVAYLLEQTRRRYAGVPGGRPVPPAASTRVADLHDLAVALGARRSEVSGTVQLFRVIHGPLMHKIERVAGPAGDAVQAREARLCASLREQLPVAGDTLAELGAGLAAAPDWLAEPHGGFGTGLESLVHATVRAALGEFDCDFAMSRGLRSLSRLVAALRAEDWDQLVRWELPEYYCCVVPAPDAARLFGGSAAAVADTAWAISSRMQYNSWHFLAGNLPAVPEVVARDYFVPPTIPDIAYFSDQHHRGHVAARVRFSIRSPQAVEVAGRTFKGFVDLRLLRCEGRPFDEQDLLAVHRASAFVAAATGAAAGLAARGRQVEVASFDSAWHRASVGS